jgi:hypothetical protein
MNFEQSIDDFVAVVENAQEQLKSAPKNRKWDTARRRNPGHFSMKKL